MRGLSKEDIIRGLYGISVNIHNQSFKETINNDKDI
jgi:hypothetical protein